MTSPTLLPQPTKLALTSGSWKRSHSPEKQHLHPFTISTDSAAPLAPQVNLLAHYLSEENHFDVATGTADKSDIHLTLSLPPRQLSLLLAAADFTDETYRLTITPAQIRIEGASPSGVACGIQSLRQLLSGQRNRLALPCLVIEDTPAMGWRGLMLDSSRHFHDVATIRRFIDLAALHKFNLFHWHLTDDQGWRLPVEGYPRLTEIAAWRDKTLIGHECDKENRTFIPARHGGFYSHEEIRAIVAYAAARGVHILPEVDVPGHVQSLVTAYPDFGNTGHAPGVRNTWGISDSTLNLEPSTFEFLGKVVSTLADLFPFRYIHFGGDEAKTGEWAASGRIQEHKKELGLETEWEVQNHFTERLHSFAASHSRSMIGWDEIVEHGNPPVDTAAMYWRDGEHQKVILKALQAGHPVVLANHRHTYLDAYQQPTAEPIGEPLAIGNHLTIEHIYAWEPLAEFPVEFQHNIMGAQGQLWCEYIPNRRHLDYMTYPRACALAQVLWTGTGREPMASFVLRLEEHLRRLDRLGVAYRPNSPA